jgi:hypothetical protein
VVSQTNINTSGLNVGGVHRVAWLDEAADARAHQGQWRLVTVRDTRTSAYTVCSQINRGILYAFRPPGDYEARREGNAVWVRYLGDGQLPEGDECA